MIDYYVKVSGAMLPHLRARPISLKRYPNGVEADFFFEKNCPVFRPAWFETARLQHSSTGAVTNYCVIDDVASLVFIANLAAIELHTFLSKQPDGDTPTTLVFDLDPGPGRALLECCRLGLKLRRLLDSVGLESFPKTSGGKGLHVYVPLNRPKITFDQTREFAHAVALVMEREYPDEVVSIMTKSRRDKKILVDWSQNHAHKTTACPYSLRAKEHPGVSTPVQWSEVQAAVKKKSAGKLVFSPSDVLKRVDKFGDLFAPVLKLKQRLPSAKALAERSV
jgi:bifunctional non-homologous end joining protein LigD